MEVFTVVECTIARQGNRIGADVAMLDEDLEVMVNLEMQAEIFLACSRASRGCQKADSPLRTTSRSVRNTKWPPQ